MKSGKVWGETHLVFSNCNSEVQYMKCKKGKQCSKHLHSHKYNMFYVISGEIEIHTWKNDYQLVDVTVLGPGERTTIKPGEYHQFKINKDAEVLEVYWVELSLGDINRESCGGSIGDKIIPKEPQCPPNEIIKESEVSNANPEYKTGNSGIKSRENG